MSEAVALKQAVLDAVVVQLRNDIALALEAAEDARETATNKENIAENKYDTLGLEAAYLAHGQSNRVARLQYELQQFESLTTDEVEEIELGALVSVTQNGQERHYFVGPGAAGVTLNVQGTTVTVITLEAPLGSALSGLGVDDVLTFNDAELEVLRVS